MEYVLTDQDVEGPFFPNLPKDYGELAKLKVMGYRNPSQKIGAMFHMGEDLLATLNPGVDLSKAGTTDSRCRGQAAADPRANTGQAQNL